MSDAALLPAGDAVSLNEIVISPELMRRPLRHADAAAETSALQALSAALPEGPGRVLKRLAQLGTELCDAGSAGISVIEETEQGESVFRWQALAGAVEPYEGGSTPHRWSPCGTCLDSGKPVLYSYPERHFTYLRQLGLPIVEGLVIPMYADGTEGATIWIVSHREDRKFDAEDVRVMTTLGAFAARAVWLRASAAPAPEADDRGGRAESVPYREGIWRGYLRDVARGDAAALAALFRESSPLVFGAALRVVGFRADAEEITGDVYARVWRMARSYDEGRGGVASWLGTIARNLSFDRLRSEAVKARCEIPMGCECRSAQDLERDLISGQARDRVRAALAALPRLQREAIELAYLSGFTCPEIAQRTGLPVGTVKTRIRLGLQKLRRLLAAA